MEPPPACASSGTDSLQGLALRRRPEIGRALGEYAVAEGELRVAVAGAYPDLSLGPGFVWDQGVNRWSLLLGLPHIALNRNRGPIGEALARRQEAGARFAERQQAVLEEVSGGVAGCRLALADVAGAESVRAATSRQAELARAAYDRGELSASALEPLELAETRALRDLHAARQRLAAAGLALETVTGAWPPGEVRWPDPRDPVRPVQEASH
jgi:cobalt-zinc-cadmium efflux system outer membrane protein